MIGISEDIREIAKSLTDHRFDMGDEQHAIDIARALQAERTRWRQAVHEVCFQTRHVKMFDEIVSRATAAPTHSPARDERYGE